MDALELVKSDHSFPFKINAITAIWAEMSAATALFNPAPISYCIEQSPRMQWPCIFFSVLNVNVPCVLLGVCVCV